MTQQTNTDPSTHQVVLDLINDNATDAETRLTDLETESGVGTVIDSSDTGITLGVDSVYTWWSKNETGTFSALLPTATASGQNDYIPFVKLNITGKLGEIVEISSNGQGNFWKASQDTGSSTYSTSTGDVLVFLKTPTQTGQSGGVWQVVNLNDISDDPNLWEVPTSGTSFEIGTNYILGDGITGNIIIFGGATDIGKTSLIYIDENYSGVTSINSQTVSSGDVLLVAQANSSFASTINLTATPEINSYEFLLYDGSSSNTLNLFGGENALITNLPIGGLGITRTITIPVMSVGNSDQKPIKITCTSNGNPIDVLNLEKSSANTWYDENDDEILTDEIQVVSGMELTVVPKGLSGWQVLGYPFTAPIDVTQPVNIDTAGLDVQIGGQLATPIGNVDSLVSNATGALIPTPLALNSEIVGGVLAGSVLDTTSMTDSTRYMNYLYTGDPINGYESEAETYVRYIDDGFSDNYYNCSAKISSSTPNYSSRVTCFSQEGTSNTAESSLQSNSPNGTAFVENRSATGILLSAVNTQTEDMTGGTPELYIATKKYVDDNAGGGGLDPAVDEPITGVWDYQNGLTFETSGQLGGTVTTSIGSFDSLLADDSAFIVPSSNVNPDSVGGFIVGGIIDTVSMSSGTEYVNQNSFFDPINNHVVSDDARIRKTFSGIIEVSAGPVVQVGDAIASVESLASETANSASHTITLNNGTTAHTLKGVVSDTEIYFSIDEQTSDMLGGDSDQYIATAKFVRDQIRNVSSLPVYADDAAAGVGGLQTDDVYKTATGELRIKI